MANRGRHLDLSAAPPIHEHRMSHLGRMLDHRRWRRDRWRHGPERARPVVRRSDDWEPPQPASPQQPEAHPLQPPSSSSPQTNKSSRTSGTDPTLDHSFLSESTAPEHGVAEAHPAAEAGSAQRKGIMNGRKVRHDHDCDNSSITSHHTSDEERQRAASPRIPRVVSGRLDDIGPFPLRRSDGGGAADSRPHVEAVSLDHQMYGPSMQPDPAAPNLIHGAGFPSLPPRPSEEALSSATTAASTQVATNRALDLALRRIRHMQLQLQEEYARLDALVLASQRATESTAPTTNDHGAFHLDPPQSLGQESERQKLDEAVTKKENSVVCGEIYPMGKLGHHVQRMQGKLLPKEAKAYQCRSISSSVRAEINLNPPARMSKTWKALSHQGHAALEESSDDEPSHNQLSLPALSQDPTTPREFKTKTFASREATDALSPPRIQRYVFRQGINLASNASSPDPVFCAASVGTTSHASNASPLSEAQEIQLVQTPTVKTQRTPMLSPESLLTDTVASQPSNMGSDMATFMHAPAPESYVRGTDRGDGIVSYPQHGLKETNHTLFMHESSKRKTMIRYWEQSNSSGRSGSTERNTSSSKSVLDDKIRTERQRRLNTSLSKQTTEKSDDLIDKRSIDVQSIRSALESNHASVGSFKIVTEEDEEEEDDSSVRSLKERFEAPVIQAPSTFNLMMERFEQKKRVIAANQQFKQAVSKFGGSTARRMSGAESTRKQVQRPHAPVFGEMFESGPDEKEIIVNYMSVKDKVKAFEASSDNKLAFANKLRSASPGAASGESITALSECNAHNSSRKRIIETAGRRSLLPQQKRSGLEVYRESLSKSYFSANYKIAVDRALPITASSFEEWQFEKDNSVSQAHSNTEIPPGSVLVSPTETNVPAPFHSNKGIDHLTSTPSANLECQLEAQTSAEVGTEEISSNIIDCEHAISQPDVVKPTPVKLVNCRHGSAPNFHDPNTAAFRPISIASSGTSLSRFSHSSIKMTATLLKFSEKARLAAMNTKTSSNIKQAQSMPTAPSIHANAVIDKLKSMKTDSGRSNGTRLRTLYPYNSSSHSISDNEFIDEKKENHFEDASTDDSSDGVTLDMSIAEVSNLTTPTALVSKVEESKNLTAKLQDDESTASSSESSSASDDASSDQSSEAAAPLLAQTMGTRPLSDDLSESTKSFLHRGDINTANRSISSRPKAKSVTFKDDLKEDDAWDMSRIKSVFPVMVTEGPAKADDVFGVNNFNDNFFGDFSCLAAKNDATGMIEKARATTPTRSNRSVKMIPTRRRYTSSCAVSLDDFSIVRDEASENGMASLSENVRQRFHDEDLRTAATRPKLPFRGPGIRTNPRTEPKISTMTGFPLSRQLRNQILKPNKSLSAASWDPSVSDRRSSASSTFTRYSDEHASLIDRLQRLREARLQRGATHHSYTTRQRRLYSRKNEFDEMSGSTQSSTGFGGRAFLASLDVD